MQKLVLAVTVLILSHHFLLRKRNSKRIKKLETHNERVVILGCSSGIGKECALQYASRGAKLVLFARRQALLEALATQCQKLGASEVHVMAGDVTIESNVEKLAELTKERLGGVDTVIYCAGMLSVRTFFESCGIQVNPTTKKVSISGGEALSQVLGTITTINYFAAVWTAKLFLPMLIETSVSPNYLVVSSMAGKAGAPTRAFYAGSKHALHGFFDSLRVEVRSLNVHIGLVCPGTVDTDLRESAVDKSLGQGLVSGSSKNKLSPDYVARRVILASDLRQREIYLPAWFGYLALWTKLLASPLVDWFAARKYKT